LKCCKFATIRTQPLPWVQGLEEEGEEIALAEVLDRPLEELD
jgi:hypothetical protein